MRVHALYTCVNILTGSEAHKEGVMASNLPHLLMHHMRSPGSSSEVGGSDFGRGLGPGLGSVMIE